MTEQTSVSETTEEARDAKLCRSGCKTDKPCHRYATEKAFDEAVPTRCPEHQRVYDEGQRMDGYMYAVEKLAAFLKSADVDQDPFGELSRLAAGTHDRAVDLAASAAHEMAVAELIADARPPEPGDPLTDEEREQKARSMVNSDALGLAHRALIGEWMVSELDRYLVLAALDDVRGVNRRSEESA